MRTDGGWVLNGQKVWTSYAQFADWGLCLARTNPDVPKQQGISALVVDMRAPGVEVRPLRQITDETEFNEVFFADVFVPDDRSIGPVERGLARRELHAHARARHEPAPARHPHPAARGAAAPRARVAARSTTRGSRRASPQAAVEVRLFQLHNWRTLSRVAKGESTRARGQRAEALLERDEQAAPRHRDGRARPGAPLWRGADDNPGDGAWQRSWLYYQASSIWAGTNEIQRNILGERVLGLPRRAERRVRSTRPDDCCVGLRRFETIAYEVDGPVARSRSTGPTPPTRRTRSMIDEIDAALDLADADDDVRVVVLAGEGKHFSAGHDLKEILAGADEWAAMRDTPEGKLRHEQVMYFDKLRAPPRLPQADDRGGAGRVRGGRADARVHVRPDRGRRRRQVLQPGRRA